jgi:hypothetical protein
MAYYRKGSWIMVFNYCSASVCAYANCNVFWMGWKIRFIAPESDCLYLFYDKALFEASG